MTSMIVLAGLLALVGAAALGVLAVTTMQRSMHHPHHRAGPFPASADPCSGALGPLDSVPISGGDGQSLPAAVARHHQQIRATMVEAARATDTPGVREELWADLAQRLPGLLRAERAVLDPAIADHIGRPTVSLLDRQRRAVADQTRVLTEVGRHGLDLVDRPAPVAGRRRAPDAAEGEPGRGRSAALEAAAVAALREAFETYSAWLVSALATLAAVDGDSARHLVFPYLEAADLSCHH